MNEKCSLKEKEERQSQSGEHVPTPRNNPCPPLLNATLSALLLLASSEPDWARVFEEKETTLPVFGNASVRFLVKESKSSTTTTARSVKINDIRFNMKNTIFHDVWVAYFDLFF